MREPQTKAAAPSRRRTERRGSARSCSTSGSACTAIRCIPTCRRRRAPAKAFRRRGCRSIKGGVLENLAYSRFWAQERKREPTPGPVNYIMESSQPPASIDDMIKGMQRGLLISRFWYVRLVDPRTIVLTGLTRDGLWWIEKGRSATRSAIFASIRACWRCWRRGTSTRSARRSGYRRSWCRRSSCARSRLPRSPTQSDSVCLRSVRAGICQLFRQPVEPDQLPAPAIATEVGANRLLPCRVGLAVGGDVHGNEATRRQTARRLNRRRRAPGFRQRLGRAGRVVEEHPRCPVAHRALARRRPRPPRSRTSAPSHRDAG